LLVHQLYRDTEVCLDFAGSGLLLVHQVEKSLAVFGKALEGGVRVSGEPDQPSDESFSRRRSAVRFSLQVFYAKYLDAVDNAGSDAAYLTCVPKAGAGQQLSRGLRKWQPLHLPREKAENWYP
jgi:hypothetical protein